MFSKKIMSSALNGQYKCFPLSVFNSTGIMMPYFSTNSSLVDMSTISIWNL